MYFMGNHAWFCWELLGFFHSYFWFGNLVEKRLMITNYYAGNLICFHLGCFS